MKNVQLTEEQITKLKQIQLEILKVFIKACGELGLKYFVIGGTLIGAVRHEGFIPWDDDIDVAMMREDYEIFIRKAQELLPKKYFVQSIYSEKNLPFNFCKIRDNETIFVESSARKFNINHGVSIDIFPLDYYPEEEKAQIKFEKKNKRIKNRIQIRFSVKQKGCLNKVKGFVIKFVSLFFSRKKDIQRREKLNTSIKESSLIANLCGAWGKKEIIDKSVFDDVVQLDFEGLKVKSTGND